jgi:7-cyano-7-deazaguanine synthase
MDSATLAYVARKMGYEILALHIRYGQRTEAKERECARTIAGHLGAPVFMEVSLDYLTRIGGSSLTDTGMEIRDYEADQEGIPATYVPFRNANLLAIATSLAEARQADAIFIGVQASDYAGYPDCRPEFIEAFQRVIDIGTADDTKIELKTPFVHLNKTQILETGIGLGVPYEDTWSCYRSDGPACGTCDSCHYRLEAFREVGIPDPIDYGEP